MLMSLHLLLNHHHFICLYFYTVWPQEAGDSWRTYSDIEAVNICASLSGVMPGPDPFAFLLEQAVGAIA